MSTILLIALAFTWCGVAAPEILRSPGNPIVRILVVALGALWINAVPGAYLLATKYWLKSIGVEPLTGVSLQATVALAGGFIVSYMVLVFSVAVGAITVFRQGGMYESGLLWVLAPFVAGKYSLMGVVVGVIVGIVVTRREGR